VTQSPRAGLRPDEALSSPSDDCRACRFSIHVPGAKAPFPIWLRFRDRTPGGRSRSSINSVQRRPSCNRKLADDAAGRASHSHLAIHTGDILGPADES